MKYLLKQRIKRKDQGFDSVRVYPGVPSFIKLANKLKIEYTKHKTQQGDHLVTDYYIFNKEDYSRLLSEYRQKINEKRDQFYVLIGFNTTPEQDLMRINFLKKRGIDAFVMPYNKMDPYQKKFARWVNRHYYKKCSFKEYLSTRKGNTQIYTKLPEMEVSRT